MAPPGAWHLGHEAAAQIALARIGLNSGTSSDPALNEALELLLRAHKGNVGLGPKELLQQAGEPVGGEPTPEPAATALLPRPRAAVGKFLRILTINDVYKLDHYPRVATAVDLARAEAEALNCVVSVHLNGDFLSPCTLTAIDGGRGMTEGLNQAGVDYVCLGNHEFDFGMDVHQLESNRRPVGEPLPRCQPSLSLCFGSRLGRSAWNG